MKSVAKGLAIAEITNLNPVDSNHDFGARLLISQSIQPFSNEVLSVGVDVSENVDHCSYCNL